MNQNNNGSNNDLNQDAMRPQSTLKTLIMPLAACTWIVIAVILSHPSIDKKKSVRTNEEADQNSTLSVHVESDETPKKESHQ